VFVAVGPNLSWSLKPVKGKNSRLKDFPWLFYFNGALVCVKGFASWAVSRQKRATMAQPLTGPGSPFFSFLPGKNIFTRLKIKELSIIITLWPFLGGSSLDPWEWPKQ
jgi:hypothetical protein